MVHVSYMPFLPTITALLCLSVAIAPCLQADAAPSCRRRCGDMEIPYPFGIDDDNPRCAMPGYELSCNDTGKGVHKTFYYGVEVLGISLLEGHARLMMDIYSYCYNTSSRDMNSNMGWSSLDLTGSPFRFSNTRNKFTVSGCRSLAYIGREGGHNDVGGLMTGCVATCQQGDLASLSDGACSGIGCCQTAIPKGLQFYQVWFDPGFNTTEIYDMSRCSYAALVETSMFTFFTSYVFNDSFAGQTPLILDWAVGNMTCVVARSKPESYACLSSNSECFDSHNGPGYICNCSNGFQGNPYLLDGCQDINECDDHQQYPCYGKCINTPGGFNCSCPTGSRGNAFTAPCQKEFSARLTTGIAIGLGAGFGILLLGLSAVFILRKHRKDIQKQLCKKYFRKNKGLLLEQLISSDENARDSTTIFSLEELKKATNNFDPTRILGSGGHGTVYKGILSDQRVVAIKKPKIIKEQEINQFINEVAILSQINHRNIVKLFGCCLETEVPLLVYDFIPNGSLFSIIHAGPSDNDFSLSWDDSLRIAAEAAGALYYLHSSASVSVFHRDVKSSNILLDGNYTAKVSDFGASRLIPVEHTHITTNVQGTFGYLDPEYYHTGHLNEKSDVYSFGVVLLELLLRKKPIFTSETGSMKNLSNYFLCEINSRPITEIVASHILEEAAEDEIRTVACLAKECLSLRGEERPSMKQVEITLQFLRNKQGLRSRNVHTKTNRDIQPLLARPVNHLQPLATDTGNIANVASSSCYDMEREFFSSASIPR